MRRLAMAVGLYAVTGPVVALATIYFEGDASRRLGLARQYTVREALRELFTYRGFGLAVEWPVVVFVVLFHVAYVGPRNLLHVSQVSRWWLDTKREKFAKRLEDTDG